MVKQKIPKSLHEAVRSGNIEAVKSMLTKGADIDSQSSENDKSTLHIAVEKNNIKMVEFLLNRGVRVDLKDSDGVTALYFALTHGQFEIADLLINAGADINSRDKNGYTALMSATLKKDRKLLTDSLKLTKELLDRGANVNIKASNGFTASILAALSGNCEVFKCLIEAGADVNYQSDKAKTSLLHVSVQKNSPEMVKALISRNVDLNIKNSKGFTALHTAIEMVNFEVAELLVEAKIDVNCTEPGQGWTALHGIACIKKNNLSLVEKILSCDDCKVDIKDTNGMTALSYALVRGNLEVADLLIAAGGDVNNQENKGLTALNLICIPENRNYITDGVELATQLLSRGVDPDLRNSMGQTALHTAFCYKDLDTVKYLIDAGAININCQDIFGRTILHYAAGYNNVESVKYLLSRDADGNIRTSYGATALHVAVKAEKFEIADLLIDAGVDVNCQENSLGWTALHMLTLTTKNKDALIQKLISRGAKVDVKDFDGMTALSYALLRGDLEMADLLIDADGDVNNQDNDGSTALSGICLPKNRKIITDGLQLAKELVKRGADVNIRSSDGVTALLSALINGELKMARYFIDSGADVKCQEKNQGYTTIHLAVLIGDVSLIRLLMSLGADINAKNNEGNTALHLSVINKQFEMMNELLSLDPDVSVKNNLGNTALETAIIQSNCRLLEQHFEVVEKDTKFPDATFSQSHLNVSCKTLEFQHLQFLCDNADVKDYEDPDPIHSIAIYNKSDLNKKVIKKLSKSKGKPRVQSEARGLALLNFEELENDTIFKLFFAKRFDKLCEK